MSKPLVPVNTWRKSALYILSLLESSSIKCALFGAAGLGMHNIYWRSRYDIDIVVDHFDKASELLQKHADRYELIAQDDPEHPSLNYNDKVVVGAQLQICNNELYAIKMTDESWKRIERAYLDDGVYPVVSLEDLLTSKIGRFQTMQHSMSYIANQQAEDIARIIYVIHNKADYNYLAQRIRSGSRRQDRIGKQINLSWYIIQEIPEYRNKLIQRIALPESKADQIMYSFSSNLLIRLLTTEIDEFLLNSIPSLGKLGVLKRKYMLSDDVMNFYLGIWKENNLVKVTNDIAIIDSDKINAYIANNKRFSPNLILKQLRALGVVDRNLLACAADCSLRYVDKIK
jgi:hypothetical protein